MDNGMNGLIDFEQILANTHYIDTTEEKLRKLEITGVNMAEDLRKEFDSARESFSALASEFKKAPSADLGKQLAPVVDTLNRIMKATEGLITQYIELNKVLTETSVNTKETFKSLPQHTQDLVKSLQKAVNVFYKLNDEQRESAKAMMQQLQATDLTDEAIKKLYTDAEHMLTFLDEVQNGAKKTGEIIDELTGEVYKNGESWRRLTEYSDIAADSYNGFSLTLNNLINTWKSYSEEERKVFGPSTLKDIELQAEKLRELDAELRKALNPKYGIKTSIAEQLAKNIELIEEYRSRIADLDRVVKVAENIPQNERTGYLEQLRNDLANASSAQEEYRVSTEKLLQIDNLASMSIKELETRVSALQQAYTMLKDTGRADFANQIAEATKQANEVLRGLKAEMDSIFKPQAAEGSIDWWRQKISELKKEINAMPEISPVKVQELHEAEDALNNLTESLKRQKEEVSELERMRERLAKAQERTRLMTTDEYKDLQKSIAAEKQKQHIEELSLALDNAKVGSLEAMQAQYNIYIAKLKSLTREEQNRADVEVEVYTKDGMVAMSTERLAIETADLYKNMKVLNESFGKHQMNVGNYAKTFSGLTFSIVQVVRELPAAAINLNTFFLAISNNIPMVIDEIQRVKDLAESTKQEVPSTAKVIIKAMKSTMFWINIAFAVGGLLFSKFGDNIKDFVIRLIKGNSVLLTTKQLLKEVNEQVKNSAKEVGKLYVSFVELQNGYARLKTDIEKENWIKNHQNDFKQLGISINSVTDAENAFIKNSNAFIVALTKQAMATAALKAAQEQAEKGFEAFLKAQTSQETMKKALADAGYDISKMGSDFADAFSSGAIISIKRKQRALIEAYRSPISRAFTGVGKVTRSEAKAAEKLLDTIEKAQGATKHALEYQQNFNKLMTSWASFTEEQYKTLEKAGFKLYDTEKHGSEAANKRIKDISKYIRDTHLKVEKIYNDALENGEEDTILKRSAKVLSEYEEKVEQLRNISEDLAYAVANSTKKLTEEDKKNINETLTWINEATEQLEKNKERQLELIKFDAEIRDADRAIKDKTLRAENIRDNLEKEFKLRRDILRAERAKELLENEKLLEEDKVDEYQIYSKYYFKELELQHWYNEQTLALRKNLNDAVILNTSKYSKEAYKAILDNINIAFTNEVESILTKAGINYSNIMSTYSKINEEEGISAANAFLNNYIQGLTDSDAQSALMLAMAKYQQEVNKAIENQYTGTQGIRHELELSKLPEGDSLMRNIVLKKHELENLRLQYELAQRGIIKLSDEEIQTLLNNMKKLEIELGKLRLDVFSQHGLFGGLLANIAPGFFGDDQLNALEQAKQTIINSLNEILQSEIEIREREKELAEDRVNEAQSAYEREIEARNNGYAHSVNTAKKELLLQQKTLRKKQAELEKAQKAQTALDSITQVSSLTTATAEFWRAFAPMGWVGILMASLATAGMFAAFVTSKAKAAQLATTYGTGGLEFLEGGSHASGNDIDLHTKNSRGRNMRAEGGEALAIINKRSTAKYRSILPGLIASLNDGTFLNKYSASINAVQQTVGNNVDLYNIESSLGTLVRQGRNQVYELGDATVIMRGNTRTVIRHQR